MTEELATIDHDTGEIVPANPAAVVPVNLFGTQDPNEVIARASEHAKALTNVIKDRRLSVRIGGKDHLLVEAWTLLGSMLGVFPVEDGDAEPVEVDGVKGFKASVTAVTRTGEVVGRATAYCMRDENTWKNRDSYALASMAQTRAASKALRGPLGFIVVLAGYNPTPAEEIPQPAPYPTTGQKAPQKYHAKLNAMLKELADQHPTGDQQTWTAALKVWAKELGFPGSRKDWTVVQMGAAIEHVDAWMKDQDVPFLNDEQGPLVEGAERRDGEAGSGGATPSTSGLTVAGFNGWCSSFGVDTETVGDAARQMFPQAESLKGLTDDERGQLRDRLVEVMTEKAAQG